MNINEYHNKIILYNSHLLSPSLSEINKLRKTFALIKAVDKLTLNSHQSRELINCIRAHIQTNCS